MRQAALAIAPIALALAACGGSDSDTATDDAAVDVNLPQQSVAYPEVPLNARETVSYAGTYRQTAPGGNTELTLNQDGTYSYTGADGQTRSGSYNWYSDGRRILIDNNGTNEIYAVGDGALYRLADENAAVTGARSEAETFRRAGTAADVMAPPTE